VHAAIWGQCHDYVEQCAALGCVSAVVGSLALLRGGEDRGKRGQRSALRWSEAKC